MLAVNSPELEIVAITTVSGNVPSDMGAVNAKKVLKQLNRLDIPVYIGEDAPLREEYIDARDTPVSYTHLDVYKRQACICRRENTF